MADLNEKRPEDQPFFKYWGKADPNYPGEPKWHPLHHSFYM